MVDALPRTTQRVLARLRTAAPREEARGPGGGIRHTEERGQGLHEITLDLDLALAVGIAESEIPLCGKAQQRAAILDSQARDRRLDAPPHLTPVPEPKWGGWIAPDLEDLAGEEAVEG